MKKFFKYIVLLLLIIGTVFFIKTPISHAAEQEDTIFKELYYSKKAAYMVIDKYHVERFHCIDAQKHIYTISKWDDGNGKYVDGPSYTVFDGYSLGVPIINQESVSFSGVLASSTAKIKSVKSVKYPAAKFAINTEKARCLPDEIKKIDATWDEDKSFFKTKEEANVFTASPDSASGELTGLFARTAGAIVYELIVEDKGIETTCTLIYTPLTQDYRESAGEWYKYPEDLDWSAISDTLTLYEQNANQLEKTYQYGDRIDWRSRDFISGLDNDNQDNQLLPYSEMTIPSTVKALKVSYSCEMPEASSAVFLDSPGDISKMTNTLKRVRAYHDYLYYRNKVHMVSINGGEWHNLYNGEVSPELPLQKGLNYLYFTGTDTTQIEEGNIRNYYAKDLLSYVVFFYWDGDEDYQIVKGQDTSLQEVEVYQGAYDEKEARENYKKMTVTETEDKGSIKRTVDVHSAYPYVWINAIPTDTGASVEVPDSTHYTGGFFKRLSTDKDYFDVEVTSADGSQTSTEKIYINWTMSSAELAALEVTMGGTLEQAYDPDVRQYYCEKAALGRLMFSYTTCENTTTEVYVDREKKATVTNKATKSLIVDTSAHEIRFTICTAIGKETTYVIYLNREEESGISESTKQRAKTMIDKMVASGYKEYLTQSTGSDSWKTFGAAAVGEEYLKGMLGYDVTKDQFKQATDWARVILELVISGENPYDYLGTNYVDGLMKCNDNGNFGAYACNIWALAALQAVGAEIPDKTIELVKKQAKKETFDLDMRGWALYAISPYIDTLTKQEYARIIQSIKEVQIVNTTDMNGIDVTGCFENSYYTNRNVMSHACVISGLVGLGIDPASQEFTGENGSDAVSILENYQLEDGSWFYSPENTAGGSFNKDVVIAVGDLYNGSNVYQRYYLTEDKYKELVEQAATLLAGSISSTSKRTVLQQAYDKASTYVSAGKSMSVHGTEYYALQEAITAIDETVKPGVFLGTAEEREQVNAVKEAIAQLTETSTYAAVMKVQEQYAAIGEARLLHYVTNADVLNDAVKRVEAEGQSITITLSKSTLSLTVGKSTTLKVTVSDVNCPVSWSSSNSAIATVKNGTITAVKAGIATITATISNGKKATCKVTVTNPTVTKPVLKLNLTKATIYAVGKNNTTTLSLTADGKKVGSTKATWKSSNTKVATVNTKGVITGKKAGSATITATYSNVSISCKVTVKKQTGSISASKATLYTKGTNHKLTLTFKENGSKVAASKISWKSSNTKTATVSSKGVITGKKTGNTTITAKYNGQKFTCKITVKAPSLNLKKSKVTIKKGKKTTITYTITPKAVVQFKSMNTKIATVNAKGVVTGKKVGTVKIKVTGNQVTKYFIVTVK